MDYFFWLLAVLMALTLIVYVFIARRFRYRTVRRSCCSGCSAAGAGRPLLSPPPPCCCRAPASLPSPGPDVALRAPLQVEHHTFDPEAMALAPDGRGALTFSPSFVRSEWARRGRPAPLANRCQCGRRAGASPPRSRPTARTQPACLPRPARPCPAQKFLKTLTRACTARIQWSCSSGSA